MGFFAILEKTGSAELWVLGVVGVCFIASSITEYLGLSMETGAFLAGIMISLKGGHYAERSIACLEPIRDIFAALFFTCIGVHVDVAYILSNLQLIIAILTVVLSLKAVIIASMVKLCGHPLALSLHIGVALAQIGEFAFVLAAHGK